MALGDLIWGNDNRLYPKREVFPLPKTATFSSQFEAARGIRTRAAFSNAVAGKCYSSWCRLSSMLDYPSILQLFSLDMSGRRASVLLRKYCAFTQCMVGAVVFKKNKALSFLCTQCSVGYINCKINTSLYLG